MSARHYSEDDLTLYYYGEARRREAIERHLEGCSSCASLYRDISGTLALIAAPEAPERGDQYGLEVWQRIRHKLPERPDPWWASLFRRDRLVVAAAAAMLVERTGDGRFTPFTVVEGFDPGKWRRTPPAFAFEPAPWVGNVRPFIVADAHAGQPARCCSIWSRRRPSP